MEKQQEQQEEDKTSTKRVNKKTGRPSASRKTKTCVSGKWISADQFNEQMKLIHEENRRNHHRHYHYNSSSSSSSNFGMSTDDIIEKHKMTDSSCYQDCYYCKNKIPANEKLKKLMIGSTTITTTTNHGSQQQQQQQQLTTEEYWYAQRLTVYCNASSMPSILNENYFRNPDDVAREKATKLVLQAWTTHCQKCKSRNAMAIEHYSDDYCPECGICTKLDFSKQGGYIEDINFQDVYTSKLTTKEKLKMVLTRKVIETQIESFHKNINRGHTNEAKALTCFCAVTGHSLMPIDTRKVHVNPNVLDGILGATPDGITFCGCLVETKVPNEVSSSKKKTYYSQVQSGLNVIDGLNGIGYLFQYALNGSFMMHEIQKEEHWLQSPEAIYYIKLWIELVEHYSNRFSRKPGFSNLEKYLSLHT